MILTDGARMVLTPTYHVHKMYVPFQDATVIPVEFDAGAYTFEGITLPRVDAIAAKAKDGKIWLAVTNVDPNQAAQIRVRLDGIKPSSALGEVLTAQKVDAVNTVDQPEAVKPVPITGRVEQQMVILRLPAKSVSVVHIQSAGAKY
jgi:alpha-L-arabinofuranosidase